VIQRFMSAKLDNFLHADSIEAAIQLIKGSSALTTPQFLTLSNVDFQWTQRFVHTLNVLFNVFVIFYIHDKVNNITSVLTESTMAVSRSAVRTTPDTSERCHQCRRVSQIFH